MKHFDKLSVTLTYVRLSLSKPFLFFLFSLSASAQQNISIITPQQNLENSVSKLAIEDVQYLLQQACNCTVDLNNTASEIQILLPEIDTAKAADKSTFEETANYPYLNVPLHHYNWSSKKESGKITLRLETPTYFGISCALYGLLQEKLGFKFYHAREQIIPQWTTWPLPETFFWSAKPRFDKKGFHLHTQHPLELTEPLLDHNYPGGIEQVKEYINWLARNGQNYFEFNLLESIDLKEWPAFSKQITDYCHERGIIAGVDVSLHMLQQKAFQLYRNFPASWRNKEKQMDIRLAKLFAADWDVLNVEFSSTEFSSGNVKKKKKLQLHLGKELKEKYNSKLMGRKHVVQETAEIGGKKKKKDYRMNAEETELDKNRGVLIHTVMFYTISEESAPVYRNKNLRHMLDLLLKEKETRETWYYPESAYWITFDNSIPMFLMPYLSARLDDILLMDSLQIPGHVTFSSGWEWGYWLFDWSIARWSWKYETNKIAEQPTATQYINEIFNNEHIANYFAENLNLQSDFLKKKEMMRYMTASTATDELPGALNIEFHPRPEWHYKWLAKKSDLETLQKIRTEKLPLLDNFSSTTKGYSQILESNLKNTTLTIQQQQILDELKQGIDITGLRAEHRKHTLEYLITKREYNIKKEKSDASLLLENAVITRKAAQKIVDMREPNYRYNLALLSTKHYEHSCYHFGYLYPVHNLHFWKREEEQFRKNKFSPFFMNIMNLWRIIGIVN